MGLMTKFEQHLRIIPGTEGPIHPLVVRTHSTRPRLFLTFLFRYLPSSDNPGLPLPCVGGRDHIMLKVSVEACGTDNNSYRGSSREDASSVQAKQMRENAQKMRRQRQKA